MPDSQLTLPVEGPPDLSPATRSRLSRLLVGLDRLASFHSLPDHPAVADPPLPFGRLLLRSRLGSGAQGIVLLADDPSHSRQVAVKVPQPAVLTDDELSERFVREARAAGGLEHPGIVPVFESGVLDGAPFLVAGYVPGPNLARWLDEHPGPVPPIAAAHFVAEIAAAVQHAHERGVLHCDLTPTNILLHPTAPADDGLGSFRPAITDFGLARLMTDDLARTRTFRIAGTPKFMAPEQVRGERRDLTARADVYSMGAILYQLITGRTPFDGDSSEEVMRRVLTASPDCPRESNPQVSRDLAAVCLRCLEKDASRRYPSATALADDLSRFLRGEPVTARRLAPLASAVRWVGRNPWRAVAAASACVMMATLAWLWATGLRHEADARALDAARAAAELRAAAGEFVERVQRIRQRREDRLPDWPTLNLEDLRRLATSPVAANHQPLLRTEAAAALSGVDLGVPRAVADGFKAYAPAFSPDGAVLALGAWLPDESGRCRVLLVDPIRDATLRTLEYPADADWQRRYAAFKQKPETVNDGCRSLVFSPDGRWLVVGTRSGWLVRWDLSQPHPTPVRWRHGPPLAAPTDDRVQQVAFTPSGKAFVSTDGARLAVWATEEHWRAAARPPDLEANIVRPARQIDTLRVRLSHRLCVISDRAPWIEAPRPALVALPRLAAVPTGQMLVGEDGGTVYPFLPECPSDPNSIERMAPFRTPRGPGTDDAIGIDLAVSADGLHMVTAVERVNHLRLWSVTSGCLLSARVPGEGSLRFDLSPDGSVLAVCTEARTLVYNLRRPPAARVIGLQSFPLDDAALAPDSVKAVASRLGRHVRVLSVAGANHFGELPAVTESLHFPDPRSDNCALVAVSPTPGQDAFISGDEVHLRTMGATPLTLSAAGVRELRFGDDGRLWIAGKAVIGWARDGTILQVPFHDAGKEVAWALSLAVRQHVVAVGLTNGVVILADARTGAVARRLSVFGCDVSAIDLTAGGDTAVFGSNLGGVRVCRLDTGEVAVDLPSAHRDAVTATALGPRGWFATGSRDGDVKVWTPDGKPVLTLPQTRPVRRVYWTADGQTLTVLAEGERGLRQWDLTRLKSELTGLGLDPQLP